VLAPGQGLLQGGKSIVFAQMPEETQNQTGTDAQSRLGIAAGTRQTQDHGLDGYPPAGVGLRVKEEFGVHHRVTGGLLKVGPGHVVEVLLLEQHAGAGAQRLDARVGQRNAVARCQPEDQFRLQRALDVDVQLGLGHLAQQRGHPLGGEPGGHAAGQVGHLRSAVRAMARR